MTKPSVILILAVIAGLIGGLLGGQIRTVTTYDLASVKQLLVEERIVIHKPNGQAATLGFVGKDGDELALALWDSETDKHARIAVGIHKEKPTIHLRDKSGVTRAVLTLDDDEEPTLVLSDAKGQGRAFLGSTNIQSQAFLSGNQMIEKRPASSLVLVNKDGQVTWQTP